jgi:small conductance mechanosensitive channel
VAESVCPAEHGALCKLVESTTSNEWLARASDWLIAKPLSILALVAIALVVRWLVHRAIDKLTTRAANGAVPAIVMRGRIPQILIEQSADAAERRQQRASTMGSLLKSIATGVVSVIVIFMAISQLGYDIAPLIASAGIVGVALGFGAQTLVKDFISGVFLTLEDQFGVGDVVNLGTATGTIEAVGLRVTRLRDSEGTVWYVRNGEILAVGNMSQQ